VAARGVTWQAREHGLRRELHAVTARRPPPSRPSSAAATAAAASSASPAAAPTSTAPASAAAVSASPPASDGAGLAWREALDDLRTIGVPVTPLNLDDVLPSNKRAAPTGDEPTANDGAGADTSADGHAAGAGGDPPAGDRRMQVLATTVRYRIMHGPIVFVRRAPAVDAEILNALPKGMELEMDAARAGWVRTARAMAPLTGGAAQRGWMLVDGASVGLGRLLERL
jgi:hypothetical protein